MGIIHLGDRGIGDLILERGWRRGRLFKDSTTGEMLAGAVDQRAGGMGIKGAASFQWGDAENVMDYWAQKITSRILQLQGKVPAQS